MSLRLNGSTSGYVEIDAPAVAGTTSITIPATTGELAVKATDGSVDLGGVNVDSSGRLLVGTSSARNNFYNAGTISPQMQIEGTTYSTSTFSIVTNNPSGTGGYPSLVFGKSAGSSVGSNTPVTSGHYLGEISFQGNDGSEFVDGARITAVVDGTSGANDLPTRLVFSTTADSASSPTERMRIDNTGRTQCYANSTGFGSYTNAGAGTSVAIFVGRHSATSTTNGTDSFRVYSNGNVVNSLNSYGPLSSDERLKQDITDANSQWDDIKNIRITNFHFKNDPAGPLQLGPIAQELEKVSPGLITRRPASEDEIADSSNSLVDGDEVLSFKASILYMKAVKALQEAMEKIETLEGMVALNNMTIDEYQHQLSSLSARLTALEGGN